MTAKLQSRVASISSESDALDSAIRTELPRVERLLLRMLGPRGDLDDLIQTVFLELCRALPKFRREAQLSTFIGGITVRVALRAMRPTAFLRWRAPLSVEPKSPVANPEEQLVASAQMRRLRAALERIKPKKRVAFVLWAFEGMGVDEIAALTGASPAATRSRIHYAQRELRALAERDPWLKEALGGSHE